VNDLFAIFVILFLLVTYCICIERRIWSFSRFRPNFPVSSVADQLAFDSESEAMEFLTENKITVLDNLTIDCKDSLQAIADLKIENTL